MPPASPHWLMQWIVAAMTTTRASVAVTPTFDDAGSRAAVCSSTLTLIAGRLCADEGLRRATRRWLVARLVYKINDSRCHPGGALGRLGAEGEEGVTDIHPELRVITSLRAVIKEIPNRK